MKKMMLLVVCVIAALIFTGCGNSVDEKKTPAEIQKEVVNMDAAKIQKMVDAYTAAIKEKVEELKEEAEKLTNVPLTEQLGEQAKSIRARISAHEDSLSKLKDNLSAYAEGLKSKK